MAANVSGPVHGSTPLRIRLRGLQRLLHGLITQRRQRQQFQQAYGRAVRGLPGIVGVEFKGHADRLDVYTFYTGTISQVEDHVYDIESAMRRAYPAVNPNWHLVRSAMEEQMDRSEPETTATVG